MEFEFIYLHGLVLARALVYPKMTIMKLIIEFVKGYV